jgi:hypothetical protein
MSYRRSAAVLVVLLALSTAVVIAATKLSVSDYSPALGDAVTQAYKGSHLVFQDFTNEAEDTGLWSYKSGDGKISFKTSHNLNQFLRLCFEKAAGNLGMMTYRDATTAAPTVPRIEIVFSSWKLHQFVGRVSLIKDGKMVYQRLRTIACETAPGAPAARAYEGLDIIFREILMEPDFKAAFFAKSPAK